MSQSRSKVNAIDMRFPATNHSQSHSSVFVSSNNTWARSKGLSTVGTRFKLFVMRQLDRFRCSFKFKHRCLIRCTSFVFEDFVSRSRVDCFDGFDWRQRFRYAYRSNISNKMFLSWTENLKKTVFELCFVSIFVTDKNKFKQFRSTFYVLHSLRLKFIIN